MNTLTAKQSDKLSLTDLKTGLSESYIKEHEPKVKREFEQTKLIFSVLKNQVSSIFFILLLVSAVLSYFLEDYVNSIIFLSINIVNVAFGFVQEFKASKASQLLQSLIKHNVSVIRDGTLVEVDSLKVIDGDIALLIPGDVVSADILIREGYDIYIDESILSGESVPVRKNVGDMVFAGTNIVAGKLTGQVVSSGGNNSLIKYSKSLETVKKHNSFSKFVSSVSMGILFVTLLSILLIGVYSVLLGEKYTGSEFILFAISMLVGVVPESLPLIITLMLSREALALSKDGVLVKRLSALQQLGSMKYLLTDKTGTITENKPKVVEVYDAEKIADIVSLVSQSNYEKNPMDLSLDTAVNNFYPHNPDYTKAKPIISSFTGSTGYGMFLFNNFIDNKSLIVIRGLYKSVISVCKNISSEMRASIDKKYSDYESNGLRVIVFASRTADGEINIEDEHLSKIEDFNFNGFVVLEDPLKQDAHRSYKSIEGLGVSLKIITGDSPLVAEYIAKKLDNSFDNEAVCSLDSVTVDSLNEHDIDTDKIYARCKPEQKLSLINRHLTKGTVGFMGEGINDALALKKSDVGIVVDNASDVARQSADLILTEKSLNPIIKAIQMSRRVYAHISTYLLCTLTGNIGTLFSLTIVALFWTDLPMLPVQILLNNLLTDVPLILLITDSLSKSDYAKPISQTARSFFKQMVLFGAISSAFDMIYFFLARSGGVEELRTGWFLFSVFAELILVLSLRSKEYSWNAPKISSPLKYSLIGCAVLAVSFIYLPGVSTVFHLVPLSMNYILGIFIITIIYFLCNELCKFFIHHYKREENNNSLTTNLQTGKVSLYLLFVVFILIGTTVVIGYSILDNKNKQDILDANRASQTSIVSSEAKARAAVKREAKINQTVKTNTMIVSIGQKTYNLEIADTEDLRELGLGKRRELKDTDGMIFIFETPDVYGFWMKDTFLSLDIVWVDKNFNIISIKEDVSPKTFPKVFYPTGESLYVLEFLSGTVKKDGIKIGQQIFFSE